MKRVVLLWITAASAGFWLPAGAAELSPGDVKEARRLYVVKCAKCHKFYEPTEYADAEWSDWMQKMSRKSKLKAAQEQVLTQYLETVRRSGTPSDGHVPRPRN